MMRRLVGSALLGSLVLTGLAVLVVRSAPPSDPQTNDNPTSAVRADLKLPAGQEERRSDSTAPAPASLAATTRDREFSVPPGPRADRPFEVTGYVRTARGGSEPIDVVELELRRVDGGSPPAEDLVVATSATPGPFAIVVPDAAGTYELRARAEGAASEWIEVENGAAGDAVDVGCILLVPAGELVGSTVDRSGTPVADAVVHVDDRPVGRTDARGGFRVTPLAAGTVSIHVEHPSLSFPPRREVTVVPGQPSLPIEFIGSPAHRLTVRVTDATGVPIERAGVMVTSDRHESNVFRSTDATGRTDLRVGGDRPLTLRVTARGYAQESRFDVTPDTEIPVVLRAEVGVAVLTCRDAAGRTLRPEGVWVGRWSERRGRFQATWRASPNGTHESVLAPITKPGRYRFAAWGGAASGAVESSFDVAPASSELHAVDVTLHPSPSIPLEVSDGGGRPVPGARVVLRASSRADWTLRVDAEGRGELPRERLIGAAGAELVVRADGYAAASLSVADPSVDRLSIRLERGGGVSGRVCDAVGTPVAHAQVAAAALEGKGAVHLTRTDATGSFHLADLPPGTVRVVASYSARAAAALLRAGDSGGWLTRVVRAGGTTECVLRLEDEPPSPVVVLVRENGEHPGGRCTVDARGPRCAPSSDTTTSVRSDGYGVLGATPPAGSLLVVYRGGMHPVASFPIDCDRVAAAGRIDVELEVADVTGRVCEDRDGAALADVLVEALARVVESPGVEPTWHPIGWSMTDEHGTFRLLGIPIGAIRLRFVLDGYASRDREVAVQRRGTLEIEPVELSAVDVVDDPPGGP